MSKGNETYGPIAATTEEVEAATHAMMVFVQGFSGRTMGDAERALALFGAEVVHRWWLSIDGGKGGFHHVDGRGWHLSPDELDDLARDTGVREDGGGYGAAAGIAEAVVSLMRGAA